MKAWERSQRDSVTQRSIDYESLPQSLEELRKWDPSLAQSSQIKHGARASQKRRLRRLKRIRDYYAAQA